MEERTEVALDNPVPLRFRVDNPVGNANRKVEWRSVVKYRPSSWLHAEILETTGYDSLATERELRYPKIQTPVTEEMRSYYADVQWSAMTGDVKPLDFVEAGVKFPAVIRGELEHWVEWKKNEDSYYKNSSRYEEIVAHISLGYWSQWDSSAKIEN